MNCADRFAKHGPIRVSADRTHLEHADGTPFFFLADTAWNGALLSSDADWDLYLEDRAAKGFTAIQFITHAPWTAALANAEGLVATDPNGRVNDKFFDRIERRMEAIKARGMLAVPVLAWAANFGSSRKLNIGHTAGAGELVEFIRYQVERIGRYAVMWVLAGDGVYSCLRARKWKRIGREMFGGSKDRAPVAMHPAGGTWPYSSFAGEDWLDVYGYQSSHSEHPKTLRWLQQGPPATFWTGHPRPTINLEPVYEGIAPVWGQGQGPFDDSAVRRAAWWSLLNAPMAGVSYGAHGVWSWQEEAGEPLNHAGMGVAQPWREAMNFRGSAAMKHVAELMRRIEWWKLRPDPLMIVRDQADDPQEYIAASRSEDGSLALTFLPRGGRVRIRREGLEVSRWEWFDPRTGQIGDVKREDVVAAPDERDWVLVGRC